MRRYLLAAGAMLALATPQSDAQSRTLTDSDFQKAEALLRIEAAGRENSAVVLAGRANYLEQAAGLTQSVIDGQKDALTEAKRLQPAFLPPPGGKYDAACSRVASRDWYPQLAVAYTFGVPADEVGRGILAGDSTMLQTLIEQDLLARPRTTEGRVRALMERTHAFYASNGYEANPMYPFIFRWGLSGDGSLVIMEPINSWFNDDCRHMGDGPTLIILSNPDPSDEHQAAETQVHNLADQWDTTLNRLGLTTQQWYALRSDVMLAHDDAHATQPVEASLDRELLAYLAESIALRKRNADAYKRHAARLDPLVRSSRAGRQ